MGKYFELDNKKIYIYGAAATGEIVFDIFSKKNYRIEGFIDKRAAELDEFKGKKVITLPDLCARERSNKEGVVIFIAVKNVFEHESIVKPLTDYGFFNVIYMPYRAVKGKAAGEEMSLYRTWNDMIKGDFEDVKAIPVTNALKGYQYRDYAAIAKYCDDKRTVLLPIDMLFTDLPKDLLINNIWTDIPAMALLPHIFFFRWQSGEAGYGCEEYLKFCIDSARKRNVKITEAWKENVIRNRADVYANMNDDLERNSEFFVKNAPLVTWNEKGYFNLNSGKHRMAFFMSKRKKYVPAVVKDDDYEKWIRYAGTDKIGEYLRKSELSELKAPISHPYMYEIKCINKDFYYNFLYRYIMLLSEKSLTCQGNVAFGEMGGIALAALDDGFLGRTLRRFGFKTKEYGMSGTGIFFRSLEPAETANELEPDKIEYSIIDGQNEEGLKLIKECQNLRLIVYMGNLQEISLDEGFRCKYKDCAVKDGRLTDIYWMEKTDVIRK